MKALIVDDSMVMRNIVKNALKKSGVSDEDFLEAPDGAAALEVLENHEVDVILMDWNMPKMTGIDALKAMRSKGCKTPVIMVTTEAERSRVIEALKSGANNYIAKPFDERDLVEKVNQVVQDAPK